MLPRRPIDMPKEDRFAAGETDLAPFEKYAGRPEYGLVLFCTDGCAELTINRFRAKISAGCIAVMLPGWVMTATGRTEDFRCLYCAFSQELFTEATFRIEHTFFRMVGTRPLFRPDDRYTDELNAWFRMVRSTYDDRENLYRNTIMRNRLQNMFLQIYDKMRRQVRTPAEQEAELSTRQAELFHRFVQLIHEHSSREREVAFYAERMCISTRYLATVVHNLTHHTPKEFIDRAVVLEAKTLLESTDLSIQEIADRMNFPDQSYLGRYFKKHTGYTPISYRNASNR